MKTIGPKDFVLSVMVSGSSLHAVLLQDGDKGPEILRRFSKHASASVGADTGGMTGPGQEMPDDAGMGDFTIKFGGASNSSELFLASEFGADGAGDKSHSDQGIFTTFELELEDILADCRDMGYSDPVVVFCEDATTVVSAEISIPGTEEDGKKNKKGSDKFELLTATTEITATEENSAFLKMSPGEDGLERYLGITAKPNGPVEQTLKALRSRKTRMPAVQLLDNEIAIYLGLARSAFYLVTSHDGFGDDAASEFGDTEFAPLLPDSNRKSLLVRAGVEDTLVLFLEDDKLLHFENLRSITTYDAPETICSRVLLLQDEYGVGDVQHVLLLSDDREDAILDSFKMFFSDTRVESLRDYIPSVIEDPAEHSRPSAYVLATGTALRLVEDELYQGSFEEINLLPRRLLRKQIRIPVSWHVFALYGFIFASVLFWIGRYFTIESDVSEMRYKIQQYPSEYANLDPQVLQARVDSINAVSAGYYRALRVLDSLLVGSDMWSRAMEKSSTDAANVKGIWIDKWRPVSGGITLSGNAIARDRIVALANEIGGEIETVTFSEIREWPVFSFEMKMPIREELPEAARYLRERIAYLETINERSNETSESN
ncbi:MAG: hypothetical protein HKN43_08730 [Rhodothermales bacterium]|nr:hypothetical protein [Rhodothermales bacterium]